MIALLALLLLGRPAVAQTPADTVQYVTLSSTRVTGSYREWRADGVLHAAYAFNDRGRGPDLAMTLRLGDHSLPTAMRIIGHGYLKDSVEEGVATARGVVSWTSKLEEGQAPVSRRGFYVPNADQPGIYRLMIRAALPQGGRLALLPSGEATVERMGALTVEVAGRPLHLTHYGLTGLDFSPVDLWLDDDATHFVLASSWSSIVPEGWESVIPALVAQQDLVSRERYHRLAVTLAHHPTGPLVIQHAGLFVAESALVRPATTVVIAGDRIVAVGPDGQVPLPAQAQIIDATGQTLLPGLWDMHVHISPGYAGLFDIAAGITTVRDMGNDTVITPALPRRFDSGELIGPRLLLAGLIDGPGPYQVPIGVTADDTASAVRAVRWYAGHGYEQIKIYSSLRPALVPVIVAEAHARGLRVSGHVPAFMRAEEVVRLGFDEVQHANMLLLNFMDTVRDTRTMSRFSAVARHGAEIDLSSPAVRDFVALFHDRGVAIDPTLVAFEDWFTARPGRIGPSEAPIADRLPPPIRRYFIGGGLPVPEGMDQRYRDSWAAMLHIVKAMDDAGVPVESGTDAFPPGLALFRELELHVDAGIPPARVLQMATIGPARIMRHDDDRGTIAVGKFADMVLVTGDPTTRISDIRRTALVLRGGVLFRPAELYKALGVLP